MEGEANVYRQSHRLVETVEKRVSYCRANRLSIFAVSSFPRCHRALKTLGIKLRKFDRKISKFILVCRIGTVGKNAAKFARELRNIR